MTTRLQPEHTVSVSRPPEDLELIEGLRWGSPTAYEQLIERFQHPVYNLAYRLLNDGEDAADVVQEVFLHVFKGIDSFRQDSSLKTWIYRIAVNETHNRRRWIFRHRKNEVGFNDPVDDGASEKEWIADPGRTPYDCAVSSETRVLIEEALAQVNPVFRDAVVLRDLEELSYEEIADILQISLGTVKSRIMRGREALRERLTRRIEPALVLDWRRAT